MVFSNNSENCTIPSKHLPDFRNKEVNFTVTIMSVDRISILIIFLVLPGECLGYSSSDRESFVEIN
jgi:hypothetical protein